ncbi:MAG TPA: SBBP repeat-containing protein, partial [Bacteroidia bacterium]|nr:SBBP repeat-containing protein [Bacteroidia bacterium]
TTDLSGNVFVTGKTDINPSLAIIDFDYVTLKYNSAGTQVWVQTSGPANSFSDGGVAILTDATGNCIVTGNVLNVGTQKDIRSIEYSSTGVSQWLKEYSGEGDHSDIVNAMTTDSNGNSYMAGYTYSSSNKRDMCVVKVNSIGDTLWVRTVNGSLNSDDEANAVVVDASGNVFMTGYTKDTITGNDYCTVKYNSSGTLLWIIKYNFATANGTDRATAMSLTPTGDIIVTGESDSDPTAITNYDIATLKYSTTGFLQWTHRFNGAANLSDQPNAISLSPSGEIVVVGKTGVTATDDDAFVMKLNQSGVLMLSATVPSAFGNDDALTVAQDQVGEIAVGIQTTNSSLNDDIHVWFSDPLGNNWWTSSYNGTGNGN